MITFEKLIGMLELLLSITEQYKGNMSRKELQQWQEISATVADIRQPD